MSQPPNPDTRPLPPGWIQQYDPNYRAWFYVNTSVNPPQSSWQHPASYPPPPGPPRDSYGRASPNNASYPPQQNWGGSGGYNGPPQGNWQGGGYNNYGSGPGPGYNQQYSYGAQSGRGYEDPRASGGQDSGRHNNGGRQGMGMGKAVLAGGAGLVGGALLMDAFEDHEDHEREEAYDDGFNQGYDDGGGPNDGFDDGGGGGGDW